MNIILDTLYVFQIHFFLCPKIIYDFFHIIFMHIIIMEFILFNHEINMKYL